MRKIIAIGESVLDTIFKNNTPVKSYVGGRIANAASSLALTGVPVTMVSECGDDHVGDIIVDFLAGNGVDVKSVDRFINGTTQMMVIFENDDNQPAKRVVYGTYPLDRLDVVWPRIDEDDIVIFGSLYAVENAQRQRLFEILQYAYDRKAIIVYLPGFQHSINYSITKVMPNILENFDLADMVIATSTDINEIFPGESGEKAYRHHMIYCNGFMNVADDLSTTIFGKGVKEHVENQSAADGKSLAWQAGYVAGAVFGMVCAGVRRKTIASIDAEAWSVIAKNAYEFAAECAAGGTNCISETFAQAKAAELARLDQDV